LSGSASATTTTDASGLFSFAGLSNGNYTLTPSLPGFGFNPASRTQTVTNTNASVGDFRGNAMWNVDTQGIPKFVNTLYLDLSQKNLAGTPLINLISKFRSSSGHDFSDSYEACRSMKHYFIAPNSETKLYAPVSGVVVNRDVPIGADISIASDLHPAFVFTIMHPVLDKAYKVGDHLTEGELIGHHVGSMTNSDIIVNVNDGKYIPKTSGYGPDGRLISYFETLTDSAFKPLKDRGINSPADLIISKIQRDAAPPRCSGESFDPTWTDPFTLTFGF
jgi:hypothetical protein